MHKADAMSAARFAPFLLAALLLGSSAHAEPSAADKRNANTLVLEGHRFLDAGDARAALDKFQAAYAITRNPATGLEVATAFEAMGKLVEARAMVDKVIQLPKQPNEPASFQQARVTAASAVDALSSRIPSLVLRIAGAPKETVTATVDGEKIPANSLTEPFQLNPGKREIVVSAPGYRTAVATVELVEGVVKPVEVPLVLERKVVVVKDRSPQQAAEARSPQHKDEPTLIKNDVILYTGIAVSGALASVGVGTAIGAAMAEQKSEDDWYAADCTNKPTVACYANFNEQENKRFLLGNTAVWTFIGATAVGAGTVVYALMAKKPEKTLQTQAVYVEPTVGGIMVRGTF
jgi:hypothetical protein